MFETDDVDDDYFTPVSNTSLANIFGSSSRPVETENESLKYEPPKAHSALKLEVAKATECIFACALFGYEWNINDYSNKGKIGFAIIKNTKNNVHDIVLYDSNKTTLSSTTVSSKLELTVKGNLHVSYYDNFNKYWSLFATEEEINKIVEFLKPLNIILTYCPQTDKEPPEPNIMENVKINSISDKGSDTDSLNKKTKDSILSRMANMGQSVLPRNTIPTEATSDSSSDNNESQNHPKTIRSKPVKNIVRRILDKPEPEMKKIETYNKALNPHTGTLVSSAPLYTCINGQMTPVENSDPITNSIFNRESDVNLLLTEQRINSTELRINVTRMSDKMDLLIDKIKEFSDNKTSNCASNFQNEILQKLLSEYENKIKMYEEIIRLKKINSDLVPIPVTDNELASNRCKEIDSYKNKISELENIILEKNKEIGSLCDEIKSCKEKPVEMRQTVKNETDAELSITSKLAANEEKSLNNEENPSDVGNKLKTVMNNTFRTISANFDDNQSYSGDTIKSIIATIIRKVTMDTLTGE